VFEARAGGNRNHIAIDAHQKRTVLTILLATCEVTLQPSRAEELALDERLIADLERVIERTRAELAALG